MLGNAERLRGDHGGNKAFRFIGSMTLSLQALKCLPRGDRIAILNLLLNYLKQDSS